ncbi:pentapeptide repeat-containing protein, partial [Desulfarculus baarsii]
GASDFSFATFSGDSDFIRATFSGDSDFISATFSGYSDFSSATFSGYSDFSSATFSDNSDFYFATFERSADFLDSKFKKLAFFNQSHFKHHAYFRRTTFDAGTFSDCIVDKHIEFERADISRLSLLRAPIESMRFIDCIWPESNGRKVVYDSRFVQGQGYFPLFNVFGADRFSKLNKPPAPGRLADLFRRLKKVARAEADEPLASDWHYAEKEMQRLDAKQNKRWPFALGLWLYKLVSGYGESPSRAGLWLVVLALLPWLAHECLDVIMKILPRDPLPNVQTLAWLNAAFSTPKEYISASINHDATGCYLYTLWLRIYQTLLLVQAGLFGLAVRNKMRR